MTDNYTRYVTLDYPIPDKTWTWNLYGAGLENIGRDGKPERFDVPEPGDDQMLVRIDSVGLCFSDVKIIRQGASHPKLYNRDLLKYPGRLGHEVALTVIKAGKNLQEQYKPGQRFAVQPDIYQDGKSTAYGYTIPGGLVQYHLIGPEVLDTDEGACLLPVTDEMGYAAAGLLEPWGCVFAAYTQRRRLAPKEGGTMWIIGAPGGEGAYSFSTGLDAPGTVVLTDVPPSVAALAAESGAEVIVRDGVAPDGYASLAEELTGGAGFDDIVVLDPRSAARASAIATHVARRGTVNLVGQTPLDGFVPIDAGRLHYDYIAFVGNRGPDIGASYGEGRNRCELQRHGTAVFVGAGGPMGQMHVQRAIELPDGPTLLIGTEVNDERLAAMAGRLAPLAESRGRRLVLFNPTTAAQSLPELVMALTDGEGADDVVVSVPSAALMEEAAKLLTPDGMFVAFAGVPTGTLVPVNLSHVYLDNAQFTGTSGLTLDDQRLVMERAIAGDLSPAHSVAAIGGLNVALEGLEGLIAGDFPGKIMIFPQLLDLPLMGLEEVAEKLSEVGAKLGPGNTWTAEAEQALFQHYWEPEPAG